jgi:hypothetical protein
MMVGMHGDLYLAYIMGWYKGPYHAMIVGIHGGLYLACIMGRYDGPYHAIIVGLYGGVYLPYIMGRLLCALSRHDCRKTWRPLLRLYNGTV